MKQIRVLCVDVSCSLLCLDENSQFGRLEAELDCQALEKAKPCVGFHNLLKFVSVIK